MDVKWGMGALAVSLLMAAANGALAEDIALKPNAVFEWDFEHDGSVFVTEGVRMELTFVRPEQADWIEGAELTVSGPGFETFTMQTVAGLSGFGEVGLFQIDTEGGWSVLFGSYTGGAHCCMDLALAWLGDDAPEAEAVGMFDGEAIYPEDLDGDGQYELNLFDSRFLYTFEAYAGSYPPAMIYKSRGGKLYEATTDPAFRHVLATEVEILRGYCFGEAGLAPSPCAALLADSAQLGTYAKTRAEIARAIDAGTPFEFGWSGFSYCTNAECTETAVIEDFLEAVDHALTEWGYLRP